jgi:hypothetical protein
MRYPLIVSGMEGHLVEVQTSTWIGGAKVLIDGRAAPPGAKKQEYRLIRQDGTVATVQLRGAGIDLLPRATVDGVPQTLAPPFQWYEWVLIILPITLVFAGGGLGGLCGGVAVTVNLSLLRGTLPAWGRYLGALAVTAIAYALFAAAMLVIRPYLPHYGPAVPNYGSPTMPSPPPTSTAM